MLLSGGTLQEPHWVCICQAGILRPLSFHPSHRNLRTASHACVVEETAWAKTRGLCAPRFEDLRNISVRRIHNILLGLVLLVSLPGCGVADGTGYLRIEGYVLDKEDRPISDCDVWIRVQLGELADEALRTDSEGKFVLRRGGGIGGLVILPVALIVAPIGGIVAAIGPWSYSEVNELFSPAYLIGESCLSHPTEIRVHVSENGGATTFSKEEIVKRLYKGKEFPQAKGCTRVYELGQFKDTSFVDRSPQ